MTEIIDAGAVIVGSPTINNGIFPTVGDFLTYMKGLKPQNKIGAAFCSYGWSGEAMEIINRELEGMKFELIDPGVKVQFVPHKEALEACYQFGRKIGQRLAVLEA